MGKVKSDLARAEAQKITERGEAFLLVSKDHDGFYNIISLEMSDRDRLSHAVAVFELIASRSVAHSDYISQVALNLFSMVTAKKAEQQL